MIRKSMPSGRDPMGGNRFFEKDHAFRRHQHERGTSSRRWRELPPGTRKFLTIDQRPIAVFNINGEFFGPVEPLARIRARPSM